MLIKVGPCLQEKIVPQWSASYDVVAPSSSGIWFKNSTHPSDLHPSKYKFEKKVPHIYCYQTKNCTGITEHVTFNTDFTAS